MRIKKQKPYFAALILIITTNFVKTCFSFYLFSFEYINFKKRKRHTQLGRAYFNIYLIILMDFMSFTNFFFIFTFFLLQRKKIYTLKLIVDLNFSLFRHHICFQSFFSSFFMFIIFLLLLSFNVRKHAQQTRLSP